MQFCCVPHLFRWPVGAAVDDDACIRLFFFIHISFSSGPTKENILDILKKRPIVGDGSYVITLEKRGYVFGGYWTPEATVQYPEAGKR